MNATGLVDDERFQNGTGKIMNIAIRDDETTLCEYVILIVPTGGDAWQRVGSAVIRSRSKDQKGAFDGCDFYEVLLA